jgi:hypothetical protein
MVNGIAVAVAGAIALQMLFSGVQGDYTKESGVDVTRAQMQVNLPEDLPLAVATEEFGRTKGVRRVIALTQGEIGERRKEPDISSQVTVGDCASLREVARLTSCRDGDVFLLRGARYDTDTEKMARPGRTLYVDPTYGDGERGAEYAWTVPQGLKQVQTRKDPTGVERGGLLFTRGALPGKVERALGSSVYLALDRSVPDANDFVRNTAARIAPFADPMTWSYAEQSRQYTAIRRGLFVGAACVLALIGASLLVSQLEQLRERKKLLSSLVAFGTRRRTLSMSVLWQTAIPIALGLLLASVVGMTLGAVLLKMTGATVSVDWASVLTMTGIGAAVVFLVTTLSLPPLLRLMRPDGLRTE